jgi:hypothetical protein
MDNSLTIGILVFLLVAALLSFITRPRRPR